MTVNYRLWTHPVVVGSGQRLVHEGNAPTGIRLLDRDAFNAEVVVLSYQPDRSESAATTLLFENWRPAEVQSIADLALAMLGVPADLEPDDER